MKIFLANHKPFEKHFKIKFEEPKVKVHTNGFISVVIDWNAGPNVENFWRFKYPELTHIGFGGDAIYKRKKYLIKTASFSFPELEKDYEGQESEVDFKVLKMTPWFDICIGHETEEEFYKNDFKYLFYEQTKYGLICWFAPRNWEDWDNAKDF
jgi:hypothetical protein